MTAPANPMLTVTEYLARERVAEVRSDYLNGETRTQPRVRRAHVRIVGNLGGELGMVLKGGPCRTTSNTQRVKVPATGLYTYPDVAITCGRPEYDPDDRDTLVNPVAVIEVLSPETERYDRGAKFRHYQQLPTVREYILVSQEETVVERFVRQPDGTWVLTVVTGLAGEVAFATVPARVAMADIYNDVEFLPPSSGPQPG